jgi:hypothetical protein
LAAQIYDFVWACRTCPPIDLDAFSLDDLKRLAAELLVRVTTVEEENCRLRNELAAAKKMPKRPKLGPSGMDEAAEPDKRAMVSFRLVLGNVGEVVRDQQMILVQLGEGGSKARSRLAT